MTEREVDRDGGSIRGRNDMRTAHATGIQRAIQLAGRFDFPDLTRLRAEAWKIERDHTIERLKRIDLTTPHARIESEAMKQHDRGLVLARSCCRSTLIPLRRRTSRRGHRSSLLL